MDKQTNQLLWLAAGIFAVMLILSIAIPPMTTATTNETTRFTTVTNGGDVTPPTGWTPGS